MRALPLLTPLAAIASQLPEPAVAHPAPEHALLLVVLLLVVLHHGHFDQTRAVRLHGAAQPPQLAHGQIVDPILDRPPQLLRQYQRDHVVEPSRGGAADVHVERADVDAGGVNPELHHGIGTDELLPEEVPKVHALALELLALDVVEGRLQVLPPRAGAGRLRRSRLLIRGVRVRVAAAEGVERCDAAEERFGDAGRALVLLLLARVVVVLLVAPGIRLAPPRSEDPAAESLVHRGVSSRVVHVGRRTLGRRLRGFELVLCDIVRRGAVGGLVARALVLASLLPLLLHLLPELVDLALVLAELHAVVDYAHELRGVDDDVVRDAHTRTLDLDRARPVAVHHPPRLWVLAVREAYVVHHGADPLDGNRGPKAGVIRVLSRLVLHPQAVLADGELGEREVVDVVAHASERRVVHAVDPGQLKGGDEVADDLDGCADERLEPRRDLLLQQPLDLLVRAHLLPHTSPLPRQLGHRVVVVDVHRLAVRGGHHQLAVGARREGDVPGHLARGGGGGDRRVVVHARGRRALVRVRLDGVGVSLLPLLLRLLLLERLEHILEPGHDALHRVLDPLQRAALASLGAQLRPHLLRNLLAVLDERLVVLFGAE